jgi:hypothetical protein
MRPEVDRARVVELLSALGRRLHAPHTLYLVGGSSAVLVGWRASTRAADVRPEPDSDELLRLLSELKETLDVNIELASPLDVLPALDGWRDHSPSVGSWGPCMCATSTFACRHSRSSSAAWTRTSATSGRCSNASS